MALLQKGVAMAAGRMPKVIKPHLHALLDYATVASFFITGAMLWKKNKRAAIGAVVCGTAATLNTVMTDYPGGLFRVVSFPTHGKLEAGLAGLTAAMPKLIGFADDPEARFFAAQSLTGTAITAMSDFDHYAGADSQSPPHRPRQEAVKE